MLIIIIPTINIKAKNIAFQHYFVKIQKIVNNIKIEHINEPQRNWRVSLPAGSVRHSPQADLSLTARAFKETFDCVVPVIVVFLLNATVRWFKVGVFTLQGKRSS